MSEITPPESIQNLPPATVLDNTRVVTAPNYLEEAVVAPILVGSKKAILKRLHELFPLEKHDDSEEGKKRKYFYSRESFEQQIDRHLEYRKHSNQPFVFAVLSFCENTPEPLPQALLDLPEKYRELRIVRTEIHR